MAPRPATTQDLADYLSTGFWTDSGEAPYAFDTSGSNVITVNITGLTAAGQTLARAALDAWEAVADVAFVLTQGVADIIYDDSEPGAYATAWFDWNGSLDYVEVNIGTDWLAAYGTSIGTYGFQTYLHETGHALGLGHAGPYNGSATYANSALFQNDSWQQSVMSYFDQDQNTHVRADHAYVLTPMMADIAAIQSLYGAPSGGPTAGNTTYGVGGTGGIPANAVFQTNTGLSRTTMTVYDEGGVDTINCSSDLRSQTVTLADGSFSSVYGKAGNLAIASGTIVENYVAGSGMDSVTGNAAANALSLGSGNDKGWGEAGHDRLDGSTGNDGLYGGEGNDSLLGSYGDDRLEGGSGDDRLDGGTGLDHLYGGVGADTLWGQDGHDSLYGLDGADRLLGGAGNDRLEGGNHDDHLEGGAGNDGVYGMSGRDSLWGQDGADALDGGAGSDWMQGGAGNDTLRGGSEADRLEGGGDHDLLLGGSGNDSFVFSGGRDRVGDWEDNRDTLLIDDALWGGVAKTVSQVLSFAKDLGADIQFDFGNGRVLLVEDAMTIASLKDDLLIV